MTGPPAPSQPTPPIRRHFEVSRLQAQQAITAYEWIVPVIRRPLVAHPDAPAARGPRAAPAAPGRAIGGT